MAFDGNGMSRMQGTATQGCLESRKQEVPVGKFVSYT